MYVLLIFHTKIVCFLQVITCCLFNSRLQLKVSSLFSVIKTPIKRQQQKLCTACFVIMWNIHIKHILRSISTKVIFYRLFPINGNYSCMPDFNLLHTMNMRNRRELTLFRFRFTIRYFQILDKHYHNLK